MGDLLPIFNQKSRLERTEVVALRLFDMRKSRWFTSGVRVEPPLSNGSGTAGTILDLVRHGQATTRGEVAAVTGLARSTVAQRVDALLARGLLTLGADAASTGGR